MLKQNAKILTFSKVVMDAFFIVAAFFVSWALEFTLNLEADATRLPFEKYAELLILSVPFFVLMQSLMHLYKPQRILSAYHEIYLTFLNCVLLFFVILAYLFVFKIYDVSRLFVGLFCTFSFLLVIFARAMLRFMLHTMRKKGFNQKHILLLGLTEQGKAYLDAISRHREIGYHAVGYLDKKEQPAYQSVPFLGKPEQLRTILETQTIDEVVIALPLKEYEQLTEIIEISENCGVKSVIIPAYTAFIPARPQIDEIDDLPLINTRYIPLDNILFACIKYGLDFIISLLVLTILSPVFLLCAILVKCSSPGPVFFSQERIGYNKKPFKMYKFRTMYVGSENGWTVKQDPRITPIGKFLRKTNLDELPQFFNVLRGDMSLVGPRPEQTEYVEQFKESIPKYMLKHRVRPGLTGWAQINGLRGDTSIQKRIQYDIYYIENWNIFLDIKIMFLTIFTKRGY